MDMAIDLGATSVIFELFNFREAGFNQKAKRCEMPLTKS